MQPNPSKHCQPTSTQNLERPTPNQQNQAHLPYQLKQREHSLARINADDKSNCLLCAYAIMIILPITLCIIISVFALPNASKSINPKESLIGTNLENCTDVLERRSLSTNLLQCKNKKTFLPGTINSMGIFVKLFSNLNQFMLFYIDLSPYAQKQNKSNAYFNQSIIFTVYDAKYSSATKNTTVINKLHSSSINVNSKIRRLSEKQYFLGYQSKIKANQQFFVEIGFQNNSAITSSSMFRINVQTVQENFTIYTILLRVSFFVLSLVVFILYFSRLLKVPKQKVSIQQRLVQIVAALTLLFNDQLYFVTVLWPNPISAFLSALFIWSFIFALYVLWIFFLLRILHEETEPETKQLKKGYRTVLLVIFYLIGLTFCAGYGIIQTGDYPLVSVSTIDYVWFRVYFSIIVFFFSMAIFYLFYLYVEICRKRPYRAHRHNVFMVISLLFTTAIIITMLMGSFEVFNFSAGLVFFTFALSNFYSYFLQYLYSPTSEQLSKYLQNNQQIDSRSEWNEQLGKTVNIQLLQLQDEKECEQNWNNFQLQSHNNQQQGGKLQKVKGNERKERLKQLKLTKNNYMNSQTHGEINELKEQEVERNSYKDSIQIESIILPAVS